MFNYYHYFSNVLPLYLATLVSPKKFSRFCHLLGFILLLGLFGVSTLFFTKYQPRTTQYRQLAFRQYAKQVCVVSERSSLKWSFTRSQRSPLELKNV